MIQLGGQFVRKKWDGSSFECFFKAYHESGATGGVRSEFEEAGTVKKIAPRPGFRKASHQAGGDMILEEGGRPNIWGIKSRDDGLRMLCAVSFHDMPGHERNKRILKVIGSGDDLPGKRKALLMPKTNCGGEDLALDLGIRFLLGENFDCVE